MAKAMTRIFQGVIDELGSGAQSTLETFLINQLGAEASADLEVTVDENNLKKAILFWNDNGTVTLRAFFEQDGLWTAD